MNTIFIDLEEKSTFQKNNSNKSRKIINTQNILKLLDYANNLIFKHSFKKDIISNKNFNNKIYLCFNRKYIAKECNRKKSGIRAKIIRKYIQIKIRKLDPIYLVFSKEFDKNDKYKEVILDLLDSKKQKNIKQVNAKNSILENDINYIEDFVKEKNIKPNKLKLLIVLNSIIDYNNEKIIEYISKYKFLDILITNKVSKNDNAKIVDQVNQINNEYGTTIEVIQKRNLTDYNIYLSYSDISADDFKSYYTLKKNSKYINFKDSDDDVNSKQYVEYEKNKYYIETIFNRMKMRMENFSKNKLGAWYELEESI